MKFRIVSLLTAVTLTAASMMVGAAADTLDQVRQNGVFKMGYRTDAAPYSFENGLGEAVGYSVDICREVAVHIKQRFKLDRIKVEFVPVATDDRFKAIQDGRIDILCGATTQTVSRRELVDFSLAIFVDGASVMFRSDGPDSFSALEGHRIGVRAATTTQTSLEQTLKELGVNAEVVGVGSHDEGLRELEANRIQAYFADRGILVSLASKSTMPDVLNLSSKYFSYEPYALAMRRGDSEFRLLVDSTLSTLYRSGQIVPIYNNAFGGVEPSDVVKAMFIINTLPR